MTALHSMNTADSARVRSREVLSLTASASWGANGQENVQVTVIGIFGPTASGKSALAQGIADERKGELISADAMQVYRGLPILTNQSPALLVGIWPLDKEASVGEYAPLAHLVIDGALESGRTPIVVGGTGLYFRAALGELRLPPAPAPGARERWAAAYDADPAAAFEELQRRDPVAAAAVHANDRRRVVRALELAEAGASLAPVADELWSAETRHPTVIVGLDPPKEELERRIVARTHAMFDAGVQEEVRAALEQPISLTARKTLGLDEVATLPRDEAIESIVVRTRRYAAYQRKWMRRIPGLVIVESVDDVLALVRARE
jgi:tRNA dimethylallyltransferase